MASKHATSKAQKKSGAAPAQKPAGATAAASSNAQPLPIEPQQVRSCLLALYGAAAARAESAPTRSLLEEDEEISLVVALKKTPAHASNKPLRIAIPHSLYNPQTNPGAEICLFTKDPPQPTEEQAALGVPPTNPVKSALAANPVEGVTKVLAITKLRKNYHQFAERRRLLASYALFLTDERIVPLLPPLLGVKFYEKKRQPVPVNLAQRDFRSELIRARDSTYMYLSNGPCVTVRISRSAFSRAQTAENILGALPQIAAQLPGKWSNIQSIHVKTQTSTALPIYNSAASIDPLLPESEEEKKKRKAAEAAASKASSSKKKKKKGQQAASSKKKKASAISNGSSAPAKKGTKRALSVKKEAAAEAANGSDAKKQKTAPPAKPAAPVAAATPATPASKRARSAAADSSDSAVAAPSAKKLKQEAVSTPVKPKAAAAGVKAKSAVKAAATPKNSSSSTKKAPATVASKKK